MTLTDDDVRAKLPKTPPADACRRCGKSGHDMRNCRARGKKLFPGRYYFAVTLKRIDGSVFEIDGPMSEAQHSKLGALLAEMIMSEEGGVSQTQETGHATE